MSTPVSPDKETATIIVVLGASAFKKTFPAIFNVYLAGALGADFYVVGYARSALVLDQFHNRISAKFPKAPADKVSEFLSRVSYVSGKYDDAESFKALEAHLTLLSHTFQKENRIFYMALPPSVFLPAAENLDLHVRSKRGFNRLVVEKPFGKDYDSSRQLSDAMAKHWSEDEIYRIDHYLGKEMVKSLMALRFANILFSSIWNRNFIDNVQIVFKETIGTQGRGGYFDEFGIIRDVLSLVAMSAPVSLSPEDIRNEKVKVLKYIKPVALDETIVGQYTSDGTEPGYKDDPTVPKDSRTPTYAACVLWIDSERWEGVPFILRAGKGLSEQKVEIRIQFKDVPGGIYDQHHSHGKMSHSEHMLPRNELVIRLQPKESVYLKLINKRPGLSSDLHTTELDLSYHERYDNLDIPDAYVSLLLDVLKGDNSSFVRSDELDAAWLIFTPLLKQLEENKVDPIPYTFGSRGPEGITEFVERFGYKRDTGYVWKKKL